MATNEGTSHLTLHLTSDDLSAGLLVAVDAAGADQRPDAGQRGADAAAQQQARPVGGIEERVPELAGLVSRAGHAKPGVARRQHEGENAVDDDERAYRRARIHPAHGQVQLGIDLVPRVVIDGGRGELDHEEHPLDGPAEDEVVDQRAGGFGMVRPMANQMPTPEMVPKTPVRMRKNLEWPTSSASQSLRAFAQSLALGQRQIESAAHGKLRDHDVEDGDDADHPARAEIRNVPKRIVHRCLL